jgi:hypothetical protein
MRSDPLSPPDSRTTILTLPRSENLAARADPDDPAPHTRYSSEFAAPVRAKGNSLLDLITMTYHLLELIVLHQAVFGRHRLAREADTPNLVGSPLSGLDMIAKWSAYKEE